MVFILYSGDFKFEVIHKIIMQFIFCGIMLYPAKAQFTMITECVTSIIHLNFDAGHSIIVSFPTKMESLFEPDLMENILRNINSRIQWSLIVGDLIKESPDVILGKNYDYLIILRSVNETNDMLDSLETQVLNLRSSSSWNPRNKFVILVIGYFTEHGEVPLILMDFLWKSSNLVNIVILIQKVGFMDVYTWFPYARNQCGTVEEVTILDKCVDGQFVMKNELFPPKDPNNLNGCPLIVSVSDFRPYLILTDNSTEDEHKYRGFEMEYIILVSKQMNMKLVYSEISNENLLNMFTDKIAEVMIEKVSDIAIGAFPLHPLLLTYGDSSNPYMFTPQNGLYPTVACTLFWAVSLGISVLDMPKSLKLRLFFMLLLWYFFIMNLMFQAAIVSFLVEPGFEKELKTFDELRGRIGK
ncbi:hypothetical protein L9F63_002202 [Diploptera punctata]|uniref:Putative ionotropic receptor ligand binding domain-containing protein n=1 Tax=Diploptera punctata TaxID=6984 RepID=A0AAD8EIK7_DIPPU|nr:hypothetical protein L9F63_002202 [Diploptera punctata]